MRINMQFHYFGMIKITKGNVIDCSYLSNALGE